MPMSTAYPDVAGSATATAAEPEGQEQTQQETPVEGQPVEGQQQQQTPAVDPNWDPKAWSLKYRDQTIVPKDRNHLISLAQQGFSYSQRMHDLNEREKVHQQNEQRYEQYRKLEEAFEKNPKFREQIFNWYQQSFQPGVQQPQQQQPDGKDGNGSQPAVPPELLQEIASLKEWKTQWEQQQAQQQSVAADQAIANEMEGLKKKYQRDDWESPSSTGTTLMQDIIKHAMENGGIKLETAYRDLMWDAHVKTTEAETLKKAAENQRAAKKAGVVSGGTSKGPGPAPEISASGMSYEQIAKEIIKQRNLT